RDTLPSPPGARSKIAWKTSLGDARGKSPAIEVGPVAAWGKVPAVEGIPVPVIVRPAETVNVGDIDIVDMDRGSRPTMPTPPSPSPTSPWPAPPPTPPRVKGVSVDDGITRQIKTGEPDISSAESKANSERRNKGFHRRSYINEIGIIDRGINRI